MIGLLTPTHHPLLLYLSNTVNVWLKFLKRVSGRVNFWQRYVTEVYLPLKYKLISSFIRTKIRSFKIKRYLCFRRGWRGGGGSDENLVKVSQFFMFGWWWAIFRQQGGLPPFSSLQQGNSWRCNFEEWLYGKRLFKQIIFFRICLAYRCFVFNFAYISYLYSDQTVTS